MNLSIPPNITKTDTHLTPSHNLYKTAQTITTQRENLNIFVYYVYLLQMETGGRKQKVYSKIFCKHVMYVCAVFKEGT